MALTLADTTTSMLLSIQTLFYMSLAMLCAFTVGIQVASPATRRADTGSTSPFRRCDSTSTRFGTEDAWEINDFCRALLMFYAHMCFYYADVITGSMRYVLGRDGSGIGAVAVHPSRAFFAVAERSITGPNVYIYSYPDLQLKHVLPGGTERAYSDVNFSHGDGNKLVTVGSFPDFTLAVWDWRAARLVLRTKAFGQEVFNARWVCWLDRWLADHRTGSDYPSRAPALGGVKFTTVCSLGHNHNPLPFAGSRRTTRAG